MTDFEPRSRGALLDLRAHTEVGKVKTGSNSCKMETILKCLEGTNKHKLKQIQKLKVEQQLQAQKVSSVRFNGESDLTFTRLYNFGCQ